MDLTLITEKFIDTVEEYGVLTDDQKMAIRGSLTSTLQIVNAVGLSRYCEKLRNYE